jgi:hypothetical protein
MDAECADDTHRTGECAILLDAVWGFGGDVTPTGRAISLREFIIDLVIVGCGVTMYYALRNGEIAAVVFFAASVLLVAAMIANHVVHRGLKKRARHDGAGVDLEI